MTRRSHTAAGAYAPDRFKAVLTKSRRPLKGCPGVTLTLAQLGVSDSTVYRVALREQQAGFLLGLARGWAFFPSLDFFDPMAVLDVQVWHPTPEAAITADLAQ